MSPITHLLASWLVAAKTTDNPRDCRLVALAGILPDADGLGMVADVVNQTLWHKQTFYYVNYHHWWLHGVFGGILIASALAGFAQRRWRVAFLAFLVFHLHLLCDLAGSRGPSLADLWPIYYLGPISREGLWLWENQWRLDGWQNRLITLALFFWALWLAAKRDDSVVAVFNRRADRTFIRVLHSWRQAWLDRIRANTPSR